KLRGLRPLGRDHQHPPSRNRSDDADDDQDGAVTDAHLVPRVVAPRVAAPLAMGWKKTTMSKVGPLGAQPPPLDELTDVPPWLVPCFAESSSVTRATSLISLSWDIRRATSF